MVNINSNVIQYALQVQEKYNVPASVTIAAYAQESGWGSSYLATTHNNYFGMTGSGTAGSYISSSGRKWASYNSMEESFNSFGKLLSGEKYSNLTKGATNVEDYIKAYGDTYAPPSDNGGDSYAEHLITIIRQNDLTKYDKVFSNETVQTPTQIIVDNVNETVNSSHWYDNFLPDTSDLLNLAEKVSIALVLFLVIIVALFFLAKTFNLSMPTKEKILSEAVERAVDNE